MADAREAYCTLLLSDDYLPGAVVLAHSLRDNGTKKQLAVLVTLESVSGKAIDELKQVYDEIIPVDRIVNRSPANLYLMNRPDLASTFTKIALWKQTQYSHLVYIDADIVSLRAPDELFNLPHIFAAVPDIGWPDCFNSGVLSLKPNLGDYYALLALAQRGVSFDGADQGLLNMHFRNWERLSFTYNCTPSGNYQYVPAYRHFQSSISLVHYIGQHKPWKAGQEKTRWEGGVYEELVGRWWAVYDKHYRAQDGPSGSQQPSKQSKTVQQYMTGETRGLGPSFAEAPASNTELSLSEQPEPPKEIEEGDTRSTPTVQQRRFEIDWDPTRQAPPTKSRPEAANMPYETYQMSQDRDLFNAPQPPEPPKGMYPGSPRDGPKAIFPWEGRAPKATRIFAEDLPPRPGPAPASESLETASSTTDVESRQMQSETETITPTTPSFSTSEPFANFTTANAWDDMPELDRYISAQLGPRKAKVQVLLNKSSPPGAEPSITSPTTEELTSRERRSSKVTDFPTEIERPSLPVTPAPVRRPRFWGAQRDEAGDLPAAEGVPEQNEWDPIVRLLELQKRQTDVLERGPEEGEGRQIPKREMVGSGASLKPGQAAELAKLAQDRVLEDREKKKAVGEEGEGLIKEEAMTQEAVTRSEGGDAAVGSRAQVMADMMKAEPKEEALQGPAPLTAAAGVPGGEELTR